MEPLPLLQPRRSVARRRSRLCGIAGPRLAATTGFVEATRTAAAKRVLASAVQWRVDDGKPRGAVGPSVRQIMTALWSKRSSSAAEPVEERPAAIRRPPRRSPPPPPPPRPAPAAPPIARPLVELRSVTEEDAAAVATEETSPVATEASDGAVASMDTFLNCVAAKALGGKRDANLAAIPVATAQLLHSEAVAAVRTRERVREPPRRKSCTPKQAAKKDDDGWRPADSVMFLPATPPQGVVLSSSNAPPSVASAAVGSTVPDDDVSSVTDRWVDEEEEQGRVLSAVEVEIAFGGSEGECFTVTLRRVAPRVHRLGVLLAQAARRSGVPVDRQVVVDARRPQARLTPGMTLKAARVGQGSVLLIVDGAVLAAGVAGAMVAIHGAGRLVARRLAAQAAAEERAAAAMRKPWFRSGSCRGAMSDTSSSPRSWFHPPSLSLSPASRLANRRMTVEPPPRARPAQQRRQTTVPSRGSSRAPSRGRESHSRGSIRPARRSGPQPLLSPRPDEPVLTSLKAPPRQKRLSRAPRRDIPPDEESAPPPEDVPAQPAIVELPMEPTQESGFVPVLELRRGTIDRGADERRGTVGSEQFPAEGMLVPKLGGDSTDPSSTSDSLGPHVGCDREDTGVSATEVMSAGETFCGGDEPLILPSVAGTVLRRKSAMIARLSMTRSRSRRGSMRSARASFRAASSFRSTSPRAAGSFRAGGSAKKRRSAGNEQEDSGFVYASFDQYHEYLEKRVQKEKHVVVVAVESYTDPGIQPVWNACEDAAEVAGIYRALGFSVDELSDRSDDPWLRPTRSNVVQALKVARDRAGESLKDGVLIVNWLGRGGVAVLHGRQDGRAQRYLLCSDSPAPAKEPRRSDVVVVEKNATVVDTSGRRAVWIVDAWRALPHNGFVCVTARDLPGGELSGLYGTRHGGGLLTYYIRKALRGKTITSASYHPLTVAALNQYLASRLQRAGLGALDTTARKGSGQSVDLCSGKALVSSAEHAARRAQMCGGVVWVLVSATSKESRVSPLLRSFARGLARELYPSKPSAHFDPSALPRLRVAFLWAKDGTPVVAGSTVPLSQEGQYELSLLVRGTQWDMVKLDKLRRTGALDRTLRITSLKVVADGAEEDRKQLSAMRLQASLRAYLVRVTIQRQQAIIKQWAREREELDGEAAGSRAEIDALWRSAELPFCVLRETNDRTHLMLEVYDDWHRISLEMRRALREREKRARKEVEMEEAWRSFFVCESGERTCFHRRAELFSRRHVASLFRLQYTEQWGRYRVEGSAYTDILRLRNAARDTLVVSFDVPAKPIRPVLVTPRAAAHESGEGEAEVAGSGDELLSKQWGRLAAVETLQGQSDLGAVDTELLPTAMRLLRRSIVPDPVRRISRHASVRRQPDVASDASPEASPPASPRQRPSPYQLPALPQSPKHGKGSTSFRGLGEEMLQAIQAGRSHPSMPSPHAPGSSRSRRENDSGSSPDGSPRRRMHGSVFSRSPSLHSSTEASPPSSPKVRGSLSACARVHA